VRPAPDFFRRRQTDTDGVEVCNHICHFERARTKQGGPPLPAVLTCPLTELVNKYSVPSTRYSVNFPPFYAALSSYAAVAVIQNLFSSSAPVPAQLSLSTEYRVLRTDLQSAAALAVGFFSPALINSTSRQSDCNSRISTLNDSGTPGSMAASPLTMAS